jgi:hypothetical protein
LQLERVYRAVAWQRVEQIRYSVIYFMLSDTRLHDVGGRVLGGIMNWK